MTPSIGLNLKELLSHIDHTMLKPEATVSDIETLCKEAVIYQTATVCVNPRFVPQAVSVLHNRLPICTVVGFPFGASSTKTKLFEAEDALSSGADEIDMVLSIGDLKSKRYHALEAELTSMRYLVGEKTLKVIVETCLLTEEEKKLICQILIECCADYIKTSTGFSKQGATFEDVTLFSHLSKGKIKIKASGGIRTLDDMEQFIRLGAERIGSSSAIQLIREMKKDCY